MQRNAYVAPWADRSEWEDVRRKIYSEKIEDVIEAYEVMTMWQLRSSSLPAFVDCTVGILQVMVQESLNEGSILNDYSLRLSYSTALIRFINHVYDVSDLKNNSLYRAAKTQNIPDWLITMRHDAAHGRVLPALETFHLAAKVSLQWLLENYWFQEEKYTNSTGENHFEDNITMNDLNLNLLPVYKTAIKVWASCCELMNNSLKQISHFSEEQLSYISELIHICKDSAFLKKKDSKCVVQLKKAMKMCTNPTDQQSKKKILYLLQNNIQKLLQSITYDVAGQHAFVQSLLQSDFMLDTSKTDWESVIHLLQSLKCFSLFLESIFELAAIDNYMAVYLLQSLLPSIQILKATWSDYLKLKKTDKWKKNPKILKKKMLMKYRRKFKNSDIRPKLRAPPKLKFEMLQNILSNPTDRSCSVALECLSLVEPPLPEALREDLRRLICIYCGSEMYKEDSVKESDKVYTLADLERQIGCKGNEENGSFTDCGSLSWSRSNESVETWSSCPLGLLPHQKTVDCNLPNDLKWITVSPSEEEGRKRTSSTLLTCQAEGMKKLKKSLENIDL